MEIDEAINAAVAAGMPKCGECLYWMTKVCPREKGVMLGGPSAGELACDKFLGNLPTSPHKPDSGENAT